MVKFVEFREALKGDAVQLASPWFVDDAGRAERTRRANKKKTGHAREGGGGGGHQQQQHTNNKMRQFKSMAATPTTSTLARAATKSTRDSRERRRERTRSGKTEPRTRDGPSSICMCVSEYVHVCVMVARRGSRGLRDAWK